jgi:XTP/dITP diphosphohydrolase
MNRLLIGTNNPGKVQELRALLRGLAAELVTPSDLGLNLQVAEDGSNYAENAIKKATGFARLTGLISLADDSGLEVDALGGAPGLHSARYLPNLDATDADRRVHLLQNLRDKPRPWTARFRSVVAVAVPGHAALWAEGECLGEIIGEERGVGGFGYDRIFLVAEAGRTMAELEMEEKNRVSHRARAVLQARSILENLFRE